LQYNPARPLMQGQNIRPPLGSLFNGQAYRLVLYPELANPNAPFAGWLTEQYRTAAHLSGNAIDYQVSGTTNMGNALL